MTDDPFTVHGTDSNDQRYEPLGAGVHQAVLAAIVHNPNQPGISGRRYRKSMPVCLGHATRDRRGGETEAESAGRLRCRTNPMHERAKFSQDWSNPGSAPRSRPKQVAEFRDAGHARRQVHAGDDRRHIRRRSEIRETDIGRQVDPRGGETPGRDRGARDRGSWSAGHRGRRGQGRGQTANAGCADASDAAPQPPAD